MKLLLTKPEDGVKNQEGTLRISVQPLRFNVDQDAMFFLKSFFTEISDDGSKQLANNPPDGMMLITCFCLPLTRTKSLSHLTISSITHLKFSSSV